MSDELEVAAEAGDLSAQFRLAVAYRTGDGVPQDHDQANRWYRRAASQGHPTAQYNLALAHAQGVVIEQDLEEAFGWFLRAATNEQPDADAQGIVGEWLIEGIGTPPDVARGIAFVRLAAEQDHVDSTLRLARLFSEGTLVPQDLEIATDLAGKLALSGNAEGLSLVSRLAAEGVAAAQLALAILHVTESTGFGVDLEQAHTWASKAHAQGYPRADELLGPLAQSRDALLAVQQGAARGETDAQIRLGDLHRAGALGIPASRALAKEWFERAAASGDTVAQIRLGDLYSQDESGAISPGAEDLGLAIDWYRKAAERGSPEARTKLAVLLAVFTGGWCRVTPRE